MELITQMSSVSDVSTEEKVSRMNFKESKMYKITNVDIEKSLLNIALEFPLDDFKEAMGYMQKKTRYDGILPVFYIFIISDMGCECVSSYQAFLLESNGFSRIRRHTNAKCEVYAYILVVKESRPRSINNMLLGDIYPIKFASFLYHLQIRAVPMIGEQIWVYENIRISGKKFPGHKESDFGQFIGQEGQPENESILRKVLEVEQRYLFRAIDISYEDYFRLVKEDIKKKKEMRSFAI